MDDNEVAAAAARDPAALAAAPEDHDLAGAPLHDDTPAPVTRCKPCGHA